MNYELFCDLFFCDPKGDTNSKLAMPDPIPHMVGMDQSQ